MIKKLILPLAMCATLASAQLDDPTKKLARDVFRELIEINTTDSIGNTTTAAEAMARRLTSAGFPAADIKVFGPNARKGNLVARIHGTGTAKPILIIGHLDVVEALKSDWTTDPFAFVEKDGYFYGRGTQDMKVNDAAVIVTLMRFMREGYKPDRDIIVALTADEEGGTSNGVDWLVKNHRDLIDAAYVLNADSGGVYTDKGKPLDLEIEASEKLYSDYQLTVTNPGGHSSLPKPDNAIYHLADALARLGRSPFPFELNSVTRSYLERLAPVDKAHTADMLAVVKNPPDQAAIARLSADPHYNSTIRTTCVATRLNAGHANNALPQTAQANVNCRILPGHSREEVRQDLIRIFADPKVMVRAVNSETQMVTDRASDAKSLPPVLPRPEVLKAIEGIAAKMWPGIPVVPDMETGASDSVYTNAAGMPSYGVNGMAIDFDDVRAHGKDERIRVTSYYDGVDFYYRLLKALTH